MPQERRKALLELLTNSHKPVKGGELASIYGVSRQVIVQDIALLRASGETVMATPQGYVLMKASNQKKVCKVIACQHYHQGLEQELKIIVSNGGKVLDVIVEHPLYGELKGNLMLENVADVEAFVKSLEASGAEPLSALTRGIHLHTIEASDASLLTKIEKKLAKEGLLV